MAFVNKVNCLGCFKLMQKYGLSGDVWDSEDLDKVLRIIMGYKEVFESQF